MVINTKEEVVINTKEEVDINTKYYYFLETKNGLENKINQSLFLATSILKEDIASHVVLQFELYYSYSYYSGLKSKL